MLWPLKLSSSVITLAGVMDRSDMPRVDSSFEAPSHFRKPVGFFPSLAKIIISPYVFIHLLKELLHGLRGFPGKVLSRRSYPKPFDHGLNDNLIGHCGCLCSQTQEHSNICLEVLFVVLCALEQSLGGN